MMMMSRVLHIQTYMPTYNTQQSIIFSIRLYGDILYVHIYAVYMYTMNGVHLLICRLKKIKINK